MKAQRFPFIPNPMARSKISSQKGTVLVTVMMMVSIAALIVTDMTYRQKLDLLRTSALLSRDQAYQYLLSAEEFAKFALADDLKNDNSQGNPVFKDTLNENWAKENQPIPVLGGFIRGRLIDLQGRFNVNSLVDTNEETAALQRRRLASLMTSLGIPDEGTAEQLVERIADWLDADQDPTGFDGQEDLDYLMRERPFRAANQFIFDLSELMVIEGMTSEELATLAPYITFLPPGVALNVNTAEQNVLSAVDQRLSVLIEGREEKSPADEEPGFATWESAKTYWQTKAQNPNAGGGGGAPAPGGVTVDPDTGQPVNNSGTNNNEVVGNFSVASEYYLLEAEAVINGKVILMRSVLYRPTLAEDEENSDIRVKTILRKLEDPLKRV